MAARKAATSKKAAKKASTAKSTKARSTTTKKAVGKSGSPKSAAKSSSKAASATKSASKTANATKSASKTATSAKSTAKSTNSAAKKKPSVKKQKSPFDTKFLERMKKELIRERETYLHQAVSLKAEADSLVASMEPGDVQFDEEGGEGDTIAVERERDLALSAKAREMIDEIDHAMTKFELGTYGICEVSGDPIPKARLEAIPWARERVEYKVGGFGRR